MSTARFDELIHAPTRLSLVSLLAATEWAEFRYLREQLGLSDSALSKQLTTLEQAGYVEIRKSFVGKRPRTSAALSRAGRAAFDGHVVALQEIVARAGSTLLPGG
ncbi:winged helix-turn-helix domain-containing protein [Micromonospora sp. 067-2]|uniref:winged helix-turn-helix domain-containing protein n=1 Tax=Micromonospora sp. 067-2 TaxID=2789270 RepID=UPI00397D502D